MHQPGVIADKHLIRSYKKGAEFKKRDISFFRKVTHLYMTMGKKKASASKKEQNEAVNVSK